MLSVEILMSVMYQTDMGIAERSNADTDILVINQCDHDGYDEEVYNGHKIRMISTTERGLSRSRNMAIKNALGDICVICDDDETYRDGYKQAIIEAFEENSKADIIAFNVEHTNARHKRKLNTKFKKSPFWKSYGSCSIAFKKDKILKTNILFDIDFGAGSGKITHGEEAVWQHDLRCAGLEIYQHPFCIATVEQSVSTWFNGYNKKYFYNMGYYLGRVSPHIKQLLKYYYVYRLNSVTDLSICCQIKWLKRGIKGYKEKLSYEEYIDNKNR